MCRHLDPRDRLALARPAAGLRGLEERQPQVPLLAGQGRLEAPLEAVVGDPDLGWLTAGPACVKAHRTGRGLPPAPRLRASQNCGAEAVMPPRRRRPGQRPSDERLYKQRLLVGNAFERIKRWRELAARYCKGASSFAAAVQVRCLAPWLHIS